MSKKIEFSDRNDLIDKLVVKKSDLGPESNKVIDGLVKALNRVKRGDKKAMQKILELRKGMLFASSEAYIELNEDELFELAQPEHEFLEEFFELR